MAQLKKDLISSPAITALPKKIKRREADLDSKVAAAVSKVHPIPNWALEVKMHNGSFKEHQPKALKQVEKGKFLYKIPDMGRRNPFDYIKLGNADAIVCTIQENERDVICDVNDGTYSFNVRI